MEGDYRIQEADTTTPLPLPEMRVGGSRIYYTFDLKTAMVSQI